MEAAIGETGPLWSLVQPAVTKSIRACVHDRAGLGWSDPSRKPRPAAVMVQELHIRLAPVVRGWPTTYRWTGTVTLGNQPTLTARWERKPGGATSSGRGSGERQDGAAGQVPGRVVWRAR
jgi:hypothetical protein